MTEVKRHTNKVKCARALHGEHLAIGGRRRLVCVEHGHIVRIAVKFVVEIAVCEILSDFAYKSGMTDNLSASRHSCTYRSGSMPCGTPDVQCERIVNAHACMAHLVSHTDVLHRIHSLAAHSTLALRMLL